MGWSSGSEVFGGIIKAMQASVPDATLRQDIYEKLIPILQDQDWDTEEDCLGADPAYDAALRKLHPGLYGD